MRETLALVNLLIKFIVREGLDVFKFNKQILAVVANYDKCNDHETCHIVCLLKPIFKSQSVHKVWNILYLGGRRGNVADRAQLLKSLIENLLVLVLLFSIHKPIASFSLHLLPWPIVTVRWLWLILQGFLLHLSQQPAITIVTLILSLCLLDFSANLPLADTKHTGKAATLVTQYAYMVVQKGHVAGMCLFEDGHYLWINGVL